MVVSEVSLASVVIGDSVDAGASVDSNDVSVESESPSEPPQAARASDPTSKNVRKR